MQESNEAPRCLEADWSETEKIYIKDKEKVKQKIAKMMADRQASLVADFDFTLTREFLNNGIQGDGSFTIFRNTDYISKEFIEKTDALHEKYRPIEMDSTRSIEERAAIMSEWWKEHFSLFFE